MVNIVGVEKVEEAIGKWDAGDLAIIEGIEILANQEYSETDLVMTSLFQARADSWPNFEVEMFRVVIRFSKIVALSLRNFGGGNVQIMGFDIKYIGDRGLEGIKYAIEDYEDSRIQFNCALISIESVQEVSPVEYL